MLLFGCDIPIDGVGVLRQPRLSDIMTLRGGEQSYIEYLSLLSQTIDVMKRNDPTFSDAYEKMTDKQKEACSVFKIMTCGGESIRSRTQDALQFFFVERLSWDRRAECFYLGGSKQRIDETNYEDICDAIQTISRVKKTHIEKNLKFGSEKARSIYEKCKAAKEKFEKSKKHGDEKSLSYSNMAAAIAAKSYGYNMFNVWDLTVYQLWDQFSRINVNYQTDLYGQKWAAWGTEPFDFSVWYKDINEDKE